MRPKEVAERSQEWLSKKISEARAKDEAERIKRRATTHYRLAKSYHDRMMYPEALAELDETIRINPNYLAAYLYLAMVYEAIGSYPEALREWERYLGFDPHSRWAQQARERYETLKRNLLEATDS